MNGKKGDGKKRTGKKDDIDKSKDKEESGRHV
jgi:hypothetical protein